MVHVDLTGRTALVTGAASGIGRACAARLVDAGASVIMLDRDPDLLESAAGALGARPVCIDVADPVAPAVVGSDIDIVINNAGLQHVAAIEDFAPETFAGMLEVMVQAPFRFVRAALPHMYDQGWGRVIGISSVHGHVASPYKSAYVAAKHALEGLSKVIALESGGRGVTANCISPGYVRTPLVERQIAAQAELHGIAIEDVVAEIMLEPAAVKRLVEPEEVAELVAYLCTPVAAMITGASLSIDGGWTAR